MFSLSKNTDTNGKTISWSVISHMLWTDEVVAEFIYFDAANAHMQKLTNQWTNQVKENAL
jgi:hypothetical protein